MILHDQQADNILIIVMGCSPSKGKLFTGIYNHQDKALQFGSCENNSDHISGGTQIKSETETELASGGGSLLQEENTPVQLQGKRHTVCDIISESVDIQETNVQSPRELLTKESKDKKDERIIKNTGCRQRERLRNTVYIQSNLNLSQAIVKAHEAAYAYMTQNIPKYDSLLGLLEKATQTQLSLQPMVTLLTLQYEEINQILDEIATEGEQMLETQGNQVALPAAQSDVPLKTDIPEAERSSSESSSDLLHHMLHQLIKKNRFLGDSVKGLGDTSLEETIEYFGLLSELLAEKLGAKRAMELRLNQVLACVESYALRKLDSEESALHNEDSGIGVENKCHNGSVRRCRHRESSGSGTSTQSSHGFSEGSSLHQAGINVDEDDDVNKDIDAENSNDDEEPKHKQSDFTDQKMSNWFQEDTSEYILQFKLRNNKKSTNSNFEWSYQKDQDIRRPKTADDLSVSCQRKHTPIYLWGAQRSQSADGLWRRVNDDMEQVKNRFPNDNQKPEWITKRQNPSQFYCLQDGNNGPFKPGLPPSLTLAFAPVPAGKNAVKRLINTFSQGVCDSSNQKPLTGASKFRGRKKSFLPVINNYSEGVSSNGNKNTNSYPPDYQFSVRPYDVDVNSFPPPPPELLMDSFEKNTSDEYGRKNLNPRCYASQSPGAAMKTASFLPSRDSISRDSLNISEKCPNGQDFEDESHLGRDCDQPAEVEKINKDETIGLGDGGNKMSVTEGVGELVVMENRDSDEGEASNFYANSHPQTTPPVSRAPLPPSSCSMHHRVQSPTALPPSPSCPVNGQRETSIKRWNRRDSNDENGFMTASTSKSFCDARSVFCQEYQSASQSVKPSCRSTLPRPWGEPKVSRERLQTKLLAYSRPSEGTSLSDPLFLKTKCYLVSQSPTTRTVNLPL